jgi:hypothetical protein
MSWRTQSNAGCRVEGRVLVADSARDRPTGRLEYRGRSIAAQQPRNPRTAPGRACQPTSGAISAPMISIRSESVMQCQGYLGPSSRCGTARVPVGDNGLPFGHGGL